MIEQFIALYPRGRITYQQTDFLELTTDVEVHRIKFIGKAEARIKRGTYDELVYCTEHPALLNYNYPLSLTTVRVREDITNSFLKTYEACLTKWRSGWRHFPSWTGLSLDNQYRLTNPLPRDYYHSLYFPDFIAEEVILLCQQYGLEVTRTAPVRQPKPLLVPPPFGMLSIGISYVIARNFYISTLR